MPQAPDRIHVPVLLDEVLEWLQPRSDALYVDGTLGLGGVIVATTNSGAGGAFTATYTIPDALKGSQRIAIRMDSNMGYFAYNWFWNATAP